MTALLSLDGRVAVVTGGAGQVGGEIARGLAGCGAKVAIFDVVEAAEGDGISSFVVDVTDRGAIERATAELSEVPQILVNAAALDSPPDAPAEEVGPFEDYPSETFDEVMQVNVKGALFACQVIGARMAEVGRGSIVNVSSAAIDEPYAGIGVYAFTKAAVSMLTMTAALEAGEHGIRVNAIAPGATLTPFTTWRLHRPDGTLDQEAYDAFVEQSKAQSPLGALGEPIDQALLIHYLVSDAARFATGNIFRVNGGQTMAW